MIGLSPTRPGILKASPLVVVTEEMSPWGVTASQLIVPVGRTTMCSASGTSRKSSSGFRLARQCSHTSRACSVSRSSSLKPYCSANRLAPSPTRKMWFVYLSTSFATSDGVLMPSSAPTAPARLVGPCMQDASSCTTPSAFGRPPYPTESSFGSSSWIFTPSITASSVSAPCSSMSNAFCTARNPLALETATGFAAQRFRGGSGCGGRIGNGISRARVAATPTAAEVRKARRDSRLVTRDSGKMRVRRCRRRAGPVNLLPVDVTDPLSVRMVVRGILGAAMALAGLALVVVSIAAEHIEWRLGALVLALWGAWSFFDSLFGWVLEPLGEFVGNALTGGAMPGDRAITIQDETTMLERLVDADPPPPPHRVVLAGIRLAEIYRTHDHDPAKAEAVIARLISRYPDAPELKYVRPA